MAIYRVKPKAKVSFVPVTPRLNFAQARARIAAWQAEMAKGSDRDWGVVEDIGKDLQMMIRIAESRGISNAILDPIRVKVNAWIADPSLANYQALLALVAESIALVNQLDV